MKCNVGKWDRTMRLAGGITALGFGLFGPLGRGARAVALGLGAMELITGLTRYCPVNQALGINTCEPRIRLAEKVKALT